jgi:signal transduction histidine kinase
VRTTTSGETVVMQLIDSGVGIDDHTAAHMFEAFYSTKPGGSGLGLPTTTKIVEAHGGRIHVQSQVGQGTQFTIELPVPPRLGTLSDGENKKNKNHNDTTGTTSQKRN